MDAFVRWWQRVPLCYLFVFACSAWTFAIMADVVSDTNRDIEQCGNRPELMEIRGRFEELRDWQVKELIAAGVGATIALGLACWTWFSRRGDRHGEASLIGDAPTDTHAE